MLARTVYHQLDQKLAGQPDRIISALLILLAIIGAVVALWGPRPLKAILLLFWLVP